MNYVVPLAILSGWIWREVVFRRREWEAHDSFLRLARRYDALKSKMLP